MVRGMGRGRVRTRSAAGSREVSKTLFSVKSYVGQEFRGTSRDYVNRKMDAYFSDALENNVQPSPPNYFLEDVINATYAAMYDTYIVRPKAQEAAKAAEKKIEQKKIQEAIRKEKKKAGDEATDGDQFIGLRVLFQDAVGMPGDPPTHEQEVRMRLLVQWREIYARTLRVREQDILPAETLRRIAYGPVPQTEKSLENAGIPGAILSVQSRVLLAVINDLNETLLLRTRLTRCRNCLQFGHMANICPRSPNRQRVRQWDIANPAN